MKNGQLKPAYNVQIASNNQFITGLSIYQRLGDTTLLPDFLNSLKEVSGQMLPTVVADAGYGSEQNYEFMEDNQIEAYVKYCYFHKKHKRAFKKDISNPANLFYNKEADFYVCPRGKR